MNVLVRASLATVALALIATGCGPAASNNSAPTVTVTQPATTPASSPASATAAAETTPAQPASNLITVPNGVGMNYQAAQDLWRSAGLHVAPAHDATGANRIPIIDSNWVVLGQDPKAGSQVTRGSFIQADVKKYSDS